MDSFSEVVIAGAGPAGLSAAETLARAGRAVTVLEQNHEIGSPIRTSGGSFIEEMEALGIPARLYHPISRVRFSVPGAMRRFSSIPVPRLAASWTCAERFQYLAERGDRGRSADSAGRARRSADRGKRRGVRRTQQRGRSTRETDHRRRPGYRAAPVAEAWVVEPHRPRSRLPAIRSGIGIRPLRPQTATRMKQCWSSAARSRLRAMPGCSRGAGGGSAWAWALLIHPDSRSGNPEDYLDQLVAGKPD